MRGAWIEINLGIDGLDVPRESLPVRGAWIEIGQAGRRGRQCRRRYPCGERGLKSRENDCEDLAGRVAPRTGSVD